jgi:Tfp pilus assembly protein PilN
MITINFCDQNDVLRKVEFQKLIVKAAAVILLSIFLTLAYWGIQEIKITYNKTELEKIEDQVKALTPETRAIQSMKLQINKVENILQDINHLRASQFQVTQVLESLVMQIPDGVWLTSVRQINQEDIIRRQIPLVSISSSKSSSKKNRNKKTKNKKIKKDQPEKFLEIQATVLGRYSDKIIINYLDHLREASIFNEVILQKVGGQLIGDNPVREFTFFVYMNSKVKVN